MKHFSLFILLLSSVAAFASEGGHGGHGEGIPWAKIGYQAFNVVIIVVGLIYFLKNGVKTHFKEKNAAFKVAAEKADNARKAAEREKQEMQARLLKLESSSDESVARARAEAADMRKQLMTDAEAASKRIKEDAKQVAELEVFKAKNLLRDHLIKQSLEAARGNLQKVSPEDHQRLQADFVNNVQGAQK